MRMARRLSADERALWKKVVETVRPIHSDEPAAEETPTKTELKTSALPQPPLASAAPPRRTQRGVGTTLDAGWDKRLNRGLVQPDTTVDLHGHNLARAYSLLDIRLEQAISQGFRLVLLVTGKPPSGDRHPVARGAIRAAVGHWLAASRHASDIAAVRNAHPRHGGAGAIYIVLRRRRS
jgi:DNA-nicking Smr family endonuclease